MVQAERFVIIQAGDYNPQTNQGSLPLFWDGFQLSQSNGITGILARGAPQPSSFQITVTNSFTVPGSVGTVIPNIPLSAPYPGNLGDNLSIYTAAGGSVGDFRVVGVTTSGAPSISLEYFSGAAGIQAPGVMVCTYLFAGCSGSPVSGTVQIGNAFFAIPAVGKQVRLNLTSLYFGSVGDTITLQSVNGTVTYGTFKVVSFNAVYQLVLRTLAPATAYTGTQVSVGTLLATVTAVRSFSQSAPVDGANGHSPGFVIQPAGGVSSIYWQAFGPSPDQYVGSLYDVLTITKGSVTIGVFRVVGLQNYFDGDHNYPGMQLQTLSSNFVGNTYQGPITLTVSAPPGNPQFLTLATGQWMIPVIGSSVNLQIIWDGALGPEYPGNIGDIVQITQTSPSQQILQAQVTSFDALGNITLQAVTGTGGFAGLTAGTVIVGPITATMAEISVPSTIGTNINQIPAAWPMVYYQGRLWYCQGDTVLAGDIVGGPSGTAAYDYADSLLCVTESPLVLGGDGFKMPLNPGNITGLAVSANLDASLGQGMLLIGTPNYVFSLQVPITRQDWISTTSQNQPQINVVQIGNGWVSANGIVAVNGDLFYYDLEPSIRSLIWAIRYFQQWGNIPLSSNEERALNLTSTTLLAYSSGIYFDNRLLMTAKPQQTQYGVIHNSILPLDFTPIATLTETEPPCWEGEYSGLQVMQLVTGNFSGQQRAFAIALTTNTAFPSNMELWELSTNGQFENGNNRVKWRVEWPAFTAGEEFDLKKLLTCELWVDQIFGKVDFLLEYRPDGEACWIKWHAWSKCIATGLNQYPGTPNKPGYAETWTMPRPPEQAEVQTGRPSDQGFQFQPRLTITGYCRIRGLMLFMSECKRQLTYKIPSSDE
jgi:hypothetical protein